jgi:hypothetical protein
VAALGAPGERGVRVTAWEGAFAIDGLPIRVRVSAHPERLAPLLHALPEAPAAAAPAIDVEIAWRDDDRGPAAIAPAFFQGVVRVGVIEDGWVLRGAGAWLTVRRTEGTTRVVGGCRATPDSIAVFTRRTLFMALALALREHARFHVHAAMVADGERAWLLVGSSGRGKSTTALALGEVGMTALADDFVAVTKDGFAIPVPRAFHLSARTRHAFPALRESEQLPDTDRQAVVVAPRQARRRAVSAVICLEGVSDQTQVLQISASEVLGRLVEESALAVVDGATRVEEQLAALRTLAERPAVAARVGPDVLEQPALLRDQIRARL